MGIEHRWHKRQAVDLNVLIKARMQGSRQARVRDISHSGLFVELPPAVAPLSKHTRVELIFVRSTKRISRILRMPALVVRSTQAGAGLMLLESSLIAFHALQTQLLAEKKTVPQRSRAMPEQVRLDDIQRLAKAMPQPTKRRDAGLSESQPDALRSDPVPMPYSIQPDQSGRTVGVIRKIDSSPGDHMEAQATITGMRHE